MKMYPQKVKNPKNLGNNFSFVGILSPTDEKKGSVGRNCGFGSLPKCQGSTTLVKTEGRTKVPMLPIK
jgi:hypothetical protein